jgi:hypothetical protein
LDVGGGAGGFAQAVVDYCPNVKVTVIARQHVAKFQEKWL